MQTPKREASYPLLKHAGEGHVGRSAEQGRGDAAQAWTSVHVAVAAVGGVGRL